jgi:hypothetical protein
MDASATHATAKPTHLQSGASPDCHGCQKARQRNTTARSASTRMNVKSSVSGLSGFFGIRKLLVTCGAVQLRYTDLKPMQGAFYPTIIHWV